MTEDEVRGQNAETRTALRQEKSTAIVTGLFGLWEKELRKISGKSKAAEAIRYALSRREALERFLADGRIEIDPTLSNAQSGPRLLQERIASSLAAKAVGEPGQHWQHFFRHAK